MSTSPHHLTSILRQRWGTDRIPLASNKELEERGKGRKKKKEAGGEIGGGRERG